jgi:hypothetical protein
MPHTNGHPTAFCPRVKSLLAFHWEHHIHRIYPIRCKCWTCPFCYRKNLGALIRQLQDCPPERFITLTCKPKLLETPLQCYHRHRPLIRRLFENARRRFGVQEYAVFCELHRSGMPHWHILQRGGFLPHHWLSAEWERLTGSKIVDIRRCHNAREAAHYVTKYVTKAARAQRIDKQYRIVTFSKHFRPPRKKNVLSRLWVVEYSRLHPEELLERYAKTHDITYVDGYFEAVPRPDASLEFLNAYLAENPEKIVP